MLRKISIFIMLQAFLAAAGQSPSLFFSEYIEGSDNNRALEIFNPASEAVSLDSCRIALAREGGGWSVYFSFPGKAILPPGETWVILHSSADPLLFPFEKASQLIPPGSPFQFTGDDALALLVLTGEDTVIVDQIGEPDSDPGLGWKVASVPDATFDHGLVRKESVYFGTGNWMISAGTGATDSEWKIRTLNDFTGLGKHDFNPFILVTDISILTESALTGIEVQAGTLQCITHILPDNASRKEIEWSSSSPLTAVVDQQGKVTAFSNGEVWIKATAMDGSGISDSVQLTITGQTSRLPVSSIIVSSEDGSNSISTRGGTLQMVATIIPAEADIRQVSWEVLNPEIAMIDETGLLTALNNGQVLVMAGATDGSGVQGELRVNISGQYVETNGILEARNSTFPEGSVYKIMGEVILSHVIFSNNIKYVQDETGGFEIYDPEGIITTLYETGDGITGLMGSLYDYFGMLRLIPLEDPGPPSSRSNLLVPETISPAEFNLNFEKYESELVRIENLKFEKAGLLFESDYNYKAWHGSDTILFRTQFASDIPGSVIPDSASLTGIAIEFNNTPKLASRSLRDIEVLFSSHSGDNCNDFQFRLYPNPVSEILYMEGPEKLAFIRIFDTFGSLVMEKQSGTAEGLNISNLSPGIYLLDIAAGTKNYKTIIIKQ